MIEGIHPEVRDSALTRIIFAWNELTDAQRLDLAARAEHMTARNARRKAVAAGDREAFDPDTMQMQETD